MVRAGIRRDTGPASVSRVEKQNGVPTLLINDQPVAPTSLYVYNVESTEAYDSAGWLDTFKGYVDKAKATGVTYLAFELYFHSPMFKTSAQPGVIGEDLDFANMDALFDYAHQQGIYLLPTIWVSNPPEWWAAQHQDELQIGYDQTAPPADAMSQAAAFNDPDYWAAMDEYVRAVVLRYRTHPALLGWSPSVGMTRENNYGPSYLSDPSQPLQCWADYSAYAKGRFRSWLGGKYITNEELRTAWSNSIVTLLTADMPLPLSAETSTALSANSAGDTRIQMKDGLDFRVHEKGMEWEHNIGLVKSLDPDHILTINPAGSFFTPAGPVARNGSADGMEWTRSPLVDMVIIHPRTSFDETPGEWNTQNYALYAFAAYARRVGKLATYALEDNAKAANGGQNVESLDRIQSLSTMLAAAGAGIGWSIEAEGNLPVWSDTELAEAAKYAHLFDPSVRSITTPSLAIVLDPKAEQAEYTLGNMMGTNSRSRDRITFYEALYKAGIAVDPIEVAEIVADPQILNNYSGVIAADMAWLSADAAQILHDYAQGGGGLFIAGRTGMFDSAGNADYSAFRTLAGLNAVPASDATSYPTWSFDASVDPLTMGLASLTTDTGNTYYLPLADWTGSGYTELGHAATGTLPATLLKKGKTVIWLPRLDIADDRMIVSLVGNWTAEADSIGFVGCSLSINAVNGYRTLGGVQLWPGGDTGYAGGGLSVWVSQLKTGSSADSYWSKFSAMLALYPDPRAIWWELCPNADASSVTYDDAVLALNEIKRLAPIAKVYVTGVPVYPLDGAHCSINTDAGSQATLDLANQLVVNGEALKGPDLSLLTSSQVADGCHANAEGETIWGNDLLGFFGK